MDPDYLPQSSGDSQELRTDRERSLTPFLRSQGPSDGQALIFNSRISPSPVRSLHRRHRRHRLSLLSESDQGTPALVRRNLSKEMDQDSDETDRVERREEKKEGRKEEGVVRMERSLAKRVSRTVSGRERLRRTEEESVRRTVKVRRRDTSDYSSQSQSEGEMVTSTPVHGQARPPLQGGSPRLRAWDGSDWLWSPRTGYTYTQSLTYRDTVTPGREVAMPHMARLPLYSYQVGQLDHTELWELSEVQLRRERLEDYSGDEGSPLSPHLIYRRRKVRRDLSSLLSSLLCYLLLPLTYLWSLTRALTLSLSETCSSLLTPQHEPRAEEDLLTDDEDESGLEQFLSNQKVIYSSVKTESNAIPSTDSSQVTNLFSLIRSLLFVDTISSTIWRLTHRNKTDPPKGNTRVPKRVIFTGVPEMPQTGAIDPYVTDERELNVQIVQDDEELQLNLSRSPEQAKEGSRVSRPSRVSSLFITILMYPFLLLQSLVSASATEISSLMRFSLDTEDDELEEEQSTEVFDQGLDTPRKQKTKMRRRKVIQQTFRQWFWSLFYRKKTVRRSRRLQGLDPEQEALSEGKRQRRKREGAGETVKMPSEIDISEDESEETAEEELIFLSYMQSLRVWLSNLIQTDHGLRVSITSFFYSLLYKKQTRHSRRLKILEPGNTEPSELPTSADISSQETASDLLDPVDKGGDDLISEEYYELFAIVWLKSIFDFSSNLFGQTEKTKETNTSNLPQTAKPVKPGKSNTYNNIKLFLHSMLFKKHERRSRRLRGLAPENGELEEKRRTRSSKPIIANSEVGSSQSEETECVYEFRLLHWMRSAVSSLSLLFRGPRDLSLSAHNLLRHNLEMGSHRERTSSEKSEHNVRTWLRSQSGVTGHTASVDTRADNTVEEQEVENFTKKKALNIFSFMFLDFLPSWTTSWFWKYRGARKSRRLRGLEPVEERAWNTWRMRTRNKEDPDSSLTSETQTEQGRVKLVLVLLLIPLLFGLLFLSCKSYPETCEKTSHYVTNSTLSGLRVLRENGVTVASYGVEKIVGLASLISSTSATLLDASTQALKSLFSGGYLLVEKVARVLIESCSFVSQRLSGGLYELGLFLYKALSSLLSGGTTLVQETLGMLRDLPQSLQVAVSTSLSSTISSIVSGTKSAFEIVTGEMSSVGSSVVSMVSVGVSSASQLTTDCITNLSGALSTGAFGISQVISSMVTSTISTVTNCVTTIISTVSSSLATWITSAMFTVTSCLTYTIDGLTNGVTSTMSVVASGVASTLSGVTSGLTSIIYSVTSGLTSTISVVTSGLTSTISVVTSGLTSTMSGVTSGVTSTISGVTSGVTSTISGVTSGVTSTIYSVTPVLVMIPYTTVASLSLLLDQAWNKTSSLFQPSQQPAGLNYDLLVDRIINSDKFVIAISHIANSKVETETLRLKDQISEVIQSQAGENTVIMEDINLKIESIKAEVTERIKRMTEEFVISKIQMEEKMSVDTKDHIEGLNVKYHGLLLEADALKQEVSSQSENSERINTELRNQIEILKTQIAALELEQRDLNQTISRCCRNQTSLEHTVDQYLADLLNSISKAPSDSSNTDTLAGWVNSFFLAKSELEVTLSSLSAGLELRIKDEVEGEVRRVAREEGEQTLQQIMESVTNTIRLEHQQRINNTETRGEREGLSREEVFKIVKNALIQYDADKTGMFDYALETAGGSVISTRCTQTYVQKTAMYSIFGIPIWYPSNNPRTVIQPGVQPGECWAFKGSTGYIVIKLSDAVVPTRFSMEHISKSMSPSGKIDSAPRDFEVLGLRSENDDSPVVLGQFSYSQDLDPLQYFDIQVPTKQAFPYIELDIKSNHGNLNYTCLYRFRVHGVSPSP